ncbi:MAG: glycosyltransferase family 4 protein [Planctomycetota bacterium]
MNSALKILHLYSDWKWTGPSEPVFNLCLGLKQKGHDVTLACWDSPSHYQGRTLPQEAETHHLAVLKFNESGKLTGFFTTLKNIKKLRSWIARHPVDIIHTHSALDNYLAGKSVVKISPRPFILRSNHHGFPLEPTWRNRSLMKRYADGYLTFSPKLLESDRQIFKLSPERSWWINGAVNIMQFHPAVVKNNLRSKWGIPDTAVVGGMVARIQRHRRFDIFLKAISLAVREIPELKILIIGRGTRQSELAIEPAKQMGLAKNIIFTGHLKDDYIDALALIDFGIFLVPGSDGSCRAVRELMALGKPMIVAKRGLLPEIVENEKEGLVVEDTPENLAGAMVRLSKDAHLRSQYGAAARTRTLKDFSLENQVEQVEQIYRQILTF